MDSLREKITNSADCGRFLEEVHSCACGKETEQDEITKVLAQVHDEGLIDVVKHFRSLKNNSKTKIDFFLTRRIFEKTLPHISASVSDVMDCVNHLFHEAGPDMAAGHIFDAYISFCEQDASRPASALAEIESGAAPKDLLTPTLVAGSHLEAETWLEETLRLTRHSDPELRRRAVFALCKINWPPGSAAAARVLETTEEIVGCSNNDGELAVAVLAVLEAVKRDESLQGRMQAVVKNALQNGDWQALHAVSETIAFDAPSVPEDLIDDILSALPRVRAENTGTINNIDYGIRNLLSSSHRENGLRALEQMLVQHAGGITIDAFDGTARTIANDPALLNKVATRWFLSGDKFLGQSVEKIIRVGGRKNAELEADPSELDPSDRRHLVFVARKAVGYLFIHPVSPANFIVSLMRQAPDEGCLEELQELLFEPLLINFPGQVRQHLTEAMERETGTVAETIKHGLDRLEAYLNDLRATGDIHELSPSLAEREAYNRYHHRIMTESFKEAERQSVFLNLFPKVVLLYGRRSIHYVSGGGGEAKRVEVPLQEHSVEMEYPRQEHLNPFGLNYLLFVMKVEQMES